MSSSKVVYHATCCDHSEAKSGLKTSMQGIDVSSKTRLFSITLRHMMLLFRHTHPDICSAFKDNPGTLVIQVT